MKTTTQLGIWMDHSVAYLMELTGKPFEVQTIIFELPKNDIEHNSDVEGNALPKSGKSGLFKFYKQIGDIMLNYQEIVLSGPSDAKINFFDYLSHNEKFLKLQVEIVGAENENPQSQNGFIREYFKQNNHI